ncbi:hypothetical protein CHS0354_030174 [Potamilus streckersoni]|uniref:Uncharacterized protein n=1 Tax=Potamilus streckersoni TaxID=2493646 RepID=A0AAE0SU57_9BIVA|nr:hypothetical protein CHS0354_030174 [Potamilus streckersoni]
MNENKTRRMKELIDDTDVQVKYANTKINDRLSYVNVVADNTKGAGNLWVWALNLKVAAQRQQLEYAVAEAKTFNDMKVRSRRQVNKTVSVAGSLKIKTFGTLVGYNTGLYKKVGSSKCSKHPTMQPMFFKDSRVKQLPCK